MPAWQHYQTRAAYAKHIAFYKHVRHLQDTGNLQSVRLEFDSSPFKNPKLNVQVQLNEYTQIDFSG